MKLLFTVCTLLVVAVAILQAKPLKDTFLLTKGVGDIWSNCSNPSDPAKIISVVLSPDPPQKGKDLTVQATVTLSENVTGGEVSAQLKYGFITIFHKTLKLCDIAKEADLPCPISAGTHTVKLTESIPNSPIGGHITGNAKVTDQNGKELACINLDFHI